MAGTEHLPKITTDAQRVQGLFFKDLPTGSQIVLDAHDALTGEKAQITFNLVAGQSQLFEFTGSPFNFYRLGSPHIPQEISEGTLVVPFAIGELVDSHDIRRLHHDFPKDKKVNGLDLGLEVILDGEPHTIAAFDIESLQLPKGSGIERTAI